MARACQICLLLSPKSFGAAIGGGKIECKRERGLEEEDETTELGGRADCSC